MIEICFSTEMGEIRAELFDKQAPLTVAHFLAYIDDGYYNGSSFYRVVREDNQPPTSVKISVVEGGFSNRYYDDMLRENFSKGHLYDSALGPRGNRPCICVETTANTGLSHVSGTLSLGRCSASEVDNSFFICVGDQPELDFGGLRAADGLGFSACGLVTDGMDIVHKIHRSPAQGQKLYQEVGIIKVSRQ